MLHINAWVNMANSPNRHKLYDEFNEFLSIEINKFMFDEKDKNGGESIRQRCYLMAQAATQLIYIVNNTRGNPILKDELNLIIDAWVSTVSELSILWIEWEQKTRTRKDPEIRASEILHAAVDVAKSINYTNITRAQIAQRAGVSVHLISTYYNLDDLKEEVVKYAVENGITEVNASVLANKHPLAANLTNDQRTDAMKYLLKH